MYRITKIVYPRIRISGTSLILSAHNINVFQFANPSPNHETTSLFLKSVKNIKVNLYIVIIISLLYTGEVKNKNKSYKGGATNNTAQDCRTFKRRPSRADHIGGEVVIEPPLSSSSSPSAPRTIDDLNVDNFALPSTGLTAMTEPACDSDMTPFQAEVLKHEDNVNDHVLCAIVPDYWYTFIWSKDRNNFHGQRENFTGTAGPTFDVTDQTRAIDIFDKMFDVDFIDRLCTETNRYAEQKIALLGEQNKILQNSRFKRWSPTDRDEMITFLTIQILQGLYPLPEEQAYFRFNGYGTMPFFAKTMSYNRFVLLKTFLHFVDSETVQDTTRLCKIRPVVDYFNDKFASLYMPSQEIVIDESLLKWQGRLSFAQKIASKAAQVGVKTYELCESASGYLWKFFVYAGKPRQDVDRQDDNREDEDRQDSRQDDDRQENRQDEDIKDEDRQDNIQDEDRHEEDRQDNRQDEDRRDDRPTNATAQIVLALIEPLLHRGHILIMDNFYNSPLLLRYLKKHNTDCFGTLRLNREFVPDSVKTLVKTELRKGEVVATYCTDLMILVWRDANIVSMISTYHDLQIGTQDKYNRLTYKPTIVLDYNKSMGGVDRKDQFLSAQPVERLRTRIWYKKLFRRLFNVAIFNCYVIYSSFHQKISHRQFRTTLAEDLLKRHRNIDLTTECRRLNVRSNTTGQLVTTVLRRNTRQKTQARPFINENHFPIRTGSKNTCCWMCPKKTRTIWKCEECDVNLCVEGCFKAYHNGKCWNLLSSVAHRCNCTLF
ncbi:hypothetical protein ABMA27_016574 [Loxostege sticticalis]|uniref:PiggyBac transposable element-derived protein domain-containing protein n=1 Tax=Loxostege sticticalis TaxID=481309 RepID=A0ABR3I2U0_LOXSC